MKSLSLYREGIPDFIYGYIQVIPDTKLKVYHWYLGKHHASYFSPKIWPLLANMPLEMRVCATHNFELYVQFSGISTGFSILLNIQWMQDDFYITKPSNISFISPISTQQDG